MHMKQGGKNGHAHLKNALEYILNPEKTKGGILAGGNCGTVPLDVLATFLETKQAFGKMDGRQGYHFVISFAKGETDEQEGYQVVKEFCEEYLGDDYEYVFAIHDDTEHVHGHIIFNSVSRTDGYKYHYKKGDWEKNIQPVTDRVSKRHGLNPLTYNEERIGESYAAWKASMTNREIAKADIDFAIEKASDMDSFFAELKRMGYEITRKGNTRKGTDGTKEYFSMKIPADRKEDVKGKGARSVRNTKLGEAYSMEAIRERIETHAYRRSYESAMKKMQRIAGGYLKPLASYRSKSQVRLFAASKYYELPNPYAVPAWRVREDMKRVGQLAAQCRYLKEKHITSMQDLEARKSFLEKQISYLTEERRTLYRIDGHKDDEMKKKCQRLEFLFGQMERRDLPDLLWEQYDDEAEMLEAELPEQAVNASQEIRVKTEALKSIRKELKLVKEIIETERKELPKVEMDKFFESVQSARRPGI